MEWLKLRARPAVGWARPLILLLVGLLVSFFAGISITNTSVYAADATWNGQSLVYSGDTYLKISDKAQIKAMNLADNSTVYGVFRQSGSSKDLLVIHFPPGADMTTVSSATYSEFGFTPPGNYTLKSSKQISTDPANENNTAQPSGCDVAGIGWIVCPVTTELAKGMDWLYDKLTGFLEAQPLNVTDTKSGLFMAWDIMRGIANSAFIIVFIIVIYSQITSIGISNYGIKKLLPRLVITAILVNISFTICAIAIDLSNITGFGIQDMFIEIRNTITTLGDANSSATFTWESITGLILSGGAAGAAAGVGGFILLAETGGSLTSALILLLPILLGLLITLIVVLLVLAARQALIVILTIISPIAFVCYMLPGTEKWFEKWRSLFFTMLIFFPAFSAVFGGSQLAGAAIIQNASSVLMAILGLGVQIAPLALAPLILKLSGGVLNRFAGVINNPNKGLIDRSRNFAKSQSEYLASRRSLSNEKLSKLNFLRNAGRAANFQQRRRKERIENYQKKADAAYESTAGHAALDRQRREIEHSKQMIEKQLDIKWNTHLEKDKTALEKDLKLRVLVDKEALGKATLDNRYAEFKTGNLPTVQGAGGALQHHNTPYMRNLMNASQDTAQHIAAQGLRQSNANRALNKQIAEKMLSSNNLLTEAAGVYGSLGEDTALASALTTMRSEYGKSVEEGRQIVKHFNLSSEQRQDHAMGRTVTATDSFGNSRTFEASNTYTREAVIEDQVTVGTVNQVKEIVSASGSSLSAYRTTISDAIVKSGVKGKAPFMGGKLIDDVAKGVITNDQDLTQYVQEWIANGKYRPEDIAITDPQGLAMLMEAARTPTIVVQRAGESNVDFATRRADQISKLRAGIDGLVEKADRVIMDEQLSAHISQGASPLLEKIRHNDFTP